MAEHIKKRGMMDELSKLFSYGTAKVRTKRTRKKKKRQATEAEAFTGGSTRRAIDQIQLDKAYKRYLTEIAGSGKTPLTKKEYWERYGR